MIVVEGGDMPSNSRYTVGLNETVKKKNKRIKDRLSN